MRSRHSSGGPSRDDVQHSTSRSTRSGAAAASAIAVMPPSETPARLARPIPSVVEQAEQVARQPVDRALAGGDGRRAVPAGVVADDAEALGEGGQLRVPHRHVGAQASCSGPRPARPRDPRCGGRDRSRQLPLGAGERALDERARRPEVGRGVEQRVERRGVDVRRDRRLGEQRVAERARRRRRPARPAARTASCAATRPRRGASSSTSRSLISSPPVASRFARMRSTSTSSPSSASRTPAAAPPVRPSDLRERLPLGVPARRRRARAPAPSPRAGAPRAAARAARTPAPARRRPGCACAAAPRIRPRRPRPRRPRSARAGRGRGRACPSPRPPRASAAPSSATRPRAVCHGSSGAPRPSCAASAATTRGPSSPSAASVPAAPPSCTSKRARASPARASSVASSQPAALSPNVTGRACCSSVRPAIGVPACSRASPAQARATPSSSSVTSESARRATSIAAVSSTSWLVAPRWTSPAASSAAAARMRSTSGTTGLPAPSDASARPATSVAPGRHAAAIASADAAGITPTSASAAASAASVSSMARIHARSDSASRSRAGAARGAKSALTGPPPRARPRAGPRRPGRAGRRGARASRARPRPGRRARSRARCRGAARSTTESTTAGSISACSGGCSTAPIHSVKARASRLPAIAAIDPCRRVSSPRKPSPAAVSPAASRIACSPATSSSVARCAASPASGTSSSMRVSISSSRSMLAADSMLATESVTLMPMPCSGVAATKMPPPGPFVARIRWALESRRSASRSVGRLTPKRCARSSSRPSRSPGCSACGEHAGADRLGDLLAGAPPQRGLAGGHARHRPAGRAGPRPQVLHAAGLAAVGRQDPRLDRHDPDAQPERLAQPRLDLARLARVRRARPRP